jgi:hypothetical protein
MKNADFIKQDWVKKYLISILVYCPETGSLTWANRNWEHFDTNFAGKTVGKPRFSKHDYKLSTAGLSIKGARFTFVTSRLCWLVYTGDWPENTIDHIDRNTFNNKMENLRDVTQAVNNANRGCYKGNVFTNIRKRGRSWRVTSKGKCVGQSVCLGKALKILSATKIGNYKLTLDTTKES